MFNNKKEKQNNSLNFENEKYELKDSYNVNNLVVANLEYISNEPTPYNPTIKKTTQKYIFEVLNENNKVRYREIFTGFITDSDKNKYFNIPYVVNITPLKEQIPTIIDNIPKYSLLLVLDEINTKKNQKKLKK